MGWIEKLNWAKTFEHRDLSLYASSENALKGHTSPILFIGGVHGDEPEGVELAKKTLEWLKSDAYQKQSGPKPEWILIPCINLDGFLKNQRTNAQGIDLNRNFPSKNWKVSEKKDRYYSGAKPLESPEAKALVELIQKTHPQVIIHSHSWKPCIVCTGPADQPLAIKLAAASGYELVQDIGYPTPGSLGEFGWAELGIPVICIEEEEKIDLEKVWPRFQSGIEQIFLNL